MTYIDAHITAQRLANARESTSFLYRRGTDWFVTTSPRWAIEMLFGPVDGWTVMIPSYWRTA